MIIKALLQVSLDGLGPNHETSIFPCGIFQYMKGVNDKPGTPNYDLKRLALESLTKRIYPNFANVDWSGNAGYDRNDPRTYFSTMGCRTANGFDINGLGQLKDGRGNICPTTIILPTLAMEVLVKRFKNVTSDYSEMIRLAHEDDNIKEETYDLAIQKGCKDSIICQPQNDFSFLAMNQENLNDIQKKTNLPKSIEAPCKKGSKIGSIDYYLGDKKIGSIPVVTTESVSKATFSFYLQQLLTHLVTGDNRSGR